MGTRLTEYVPQGEIFYISQSGDIVEAEVLCPLTTGKCILQRSNVISSAVSSGVNSDTGLAATLRSDTDGYRVFYHDNAATIRQIRFQNPNITWGQGIPVTSDTNESLIGLTTDSGANLTAYGIDESGRIRSSILKSNETWQECRHKPTHPKPSLCPTKTSHKVPQQTQSQSNNS